MNNVKARAIFNMGLPQFRFTLSHDTTGHTVDLQSPLSDWINQGALGISWITSTPVHVSTNSSGDFSKNLIGGLTNARPGRYTFNYTVNITRPVGSTGFFETFTIKLLDSAFNTLDSDSLIYTTLGSHTDQIILDCTVAPAYVALQVEMIGALVTIRVDVNAMALTYGSVTTQEISEPLGWKKAILKLERHPEFHSLVEYFEGSFTFYGSNGIQDGGINFIKEVDWVYGFDAIIVVLIEISFDHGVSYEQVFSGTLDLSEKQELPDNLMDVPIIQNNIWTKFIAQLNTPVSLSSTTDLKGNPITPLEPVDINLPSQKIRKIHYSYQIDGVAFIIVINEYAQFTPGFFELDEMDNFYRLQPLNNPDKPVWFFDAIYKGKYTIEINWTISEVLGAGPPTFNGTFTLVDDVVFYLQINDDTEIPLTVNSFITGSGIGYSIISINHPVDLNEGDVVRVYGLASATRNIVFWGKLGVKFPVGIPIKNYNRPTDMAEIPTYTRVTADTVFPSTEAKGYYMHDVFAGIMDRITGN